MSLGSAPLPGDDAAGFQLIMMAGARAKPRVAGVEERPLAFARSE